MCLVFMHALAGLMERNYSPGDPQFSKEVLNLLSGREDMAGQVFVADFCQWSMQES